MKIKPFNFLLAPFLLCPLYSSAEKAFPVDALVHPMTDPAVVTVGGSDSDISGYTSRAIQLAIDAVHSRGGGTIRLSPGTFDISGPIRLSSNMTLEGAGDETILKKSEGYTTDFLVDADWGMLKVSVKDSSGFQSGNGIQLYDDLHNGGWDVTTALITAIRGNVLYLDNATVNDYIASENGTISNSFSIIEAVGAENVRIANLVIDGSKASNLYINGCRGGGVYLHKAKNCLVEGVHVRYFNGDSFSWQVTENITIRNCEASYGGGLGFHPGTGSDHSVVEQNVSHHNDEDGFFLCWRVQNGVFRNNVSYANGRYGISIGHKDTDNIFENNHIYENASHGIRFREENEQNGGHRNTFRNNLIENNGTSGEQAFGFYISGITHDIVIEENVIRSTGKGNQAAAVFQSRSTERISLTNNKIAGHPELVQEQDR
jgi:polygalacturonase